MRSLLQYSVACSYMKPLQYTCSQLLMHKWKHISWSRLNLCRSLYKMCLTYLQQKRVHCVNTIYFPLPITITNTPSQLCQSLQSEDVAKTFRTSKQHDKNAEKIAGIIHRTRIFSGLFLSRNQDLYHLSVPTYSLKKHI